MENCQHNRIVEITNQGVPDCEWCQDCGRRLPKGYKAAQEQAVARMPRCYDNMMPVPFDDDDLKYRPTLASIGARMGVSFDEMLSAAQTLNASMAKAIPTLQQLIDGLGRLSADYLRGIPPLPKLIRDTGESKGQTTHTPYVIHLQAKAGTTQSIEQAYLDWRSRSPAFDLGEIYREAGWGCRTQNHLRDNNASNIYGIDLGYVKEVNLTYTRDINAKVYGDYVPRTQEESIEQFKAMNQPFMVYDEHSIPTERQFKAVLQSGMGYGKTEQLRRAIKSRTTPHDGL